MEILVLIEKALGMAEKIPPGLAGLLIAACIALVWIGQSLRRDKQESKLVAQLQESLEASNAAMAAANAIAAQERQRADLISSQLLALSVSASRANVLMEAMSRDLERESTTNENLKQRIVHLEHTVESLVLEIRNKDKSIGELVKLNRQLLASLPTPSTPPGYTVHQLPSPDHG